MEVRSNMTALGASRPFLELRPNTELMILPAAPAKSQKSEVSG